MSANWYLSNQLKNKEIIDNAANWNPAQSIGYLELPCGCGKTTATLNGELQNFLNTSLKLDKPIETGSTSLWIARKAPILQLEQNQRTKELVVDAKSLEAYNAWNKSVSIGTVQCLVNAINNPSESNRQIRSLVNRGILFIDEAHLISDAAFVPEMNNFVNLLKDCVLNKETLVVLCSATMEYVRDYALNPMFSSWDIPLFDLVGKQLPAINSPETIEVVPHSSAITAVKELWDKIDENHKCLVITRSSTTANSIVSERNRYYKDAALAVSESNRYYNRADKENHVSIIENNRYRKGINITVATNIYEAAIELKDERIKYFITDSNTETGIVQGISRARDYPLELVRIVQDGTNSYINKAEYKKIDEALKSIDTSSQDSLYKYYDEYLNNNEAYINQLIGIEDKIIPMVYKDKDIYRINQSVMIHNQYQLDNDMNTYVDDSIAEEHYERICERYQSKFIYNTKEKSKYYNKIANINNNNLKNRMKYKKETFIKFIGNWYFKESEETQELLTILNQKNKDGTLVALTGIINNKEIKTELENIGIEIIYKRKQLNKKRQMAWTIAEINK